MTVTETPAVSRDVARTLYTNMVRECAVDERLRRGIASGEFMTVIWPSRGQEAIPAAVGAALRQDDRMVTTYRGLHDSIGKGVPMTEIIGEVLGRRAGASGGKGGTMHITDPEHGLMLTTGIVGAGVPIAVGLALGARQQKSDRVVVVNFGDGATNTGSFHEGMNLAAVWNLPVIFICQNNLYAEMTPIAATMKIDEVWKRALGYDMVGFRVDGNDPEAMYLAVAEAVERGRNGGGPTFIEALTFRFNGHYFGDKSAYIPAEEMAEAIENDPIVKYRTKLIGSGEFTEAELDEIDAAAAAEVAEAVKTVMASGVPDVSDLDKDLFEGDNLKGIPA